MTIQRLYEIIESRKGGDIESSYSARLLELGTERIAQKIGEEALETAIAAVTRNRKAMIDESADLIYHLLVAWVDSRISPDDVMNELESREGISGLAEKAARRK